MTSELIICPSCKTRNLSSRTTCLSCGVSLVIPQETDFHPPSLEKSENAVAANWITPEIKKRIRSNLAPPIKGLINCTLFIAGWIGIWKILEFFLLAFGLANHNDIKRDEGVVLLAIASILYFLLLYCRSRIRQEFPRLRDVIDFENLD